MKSTTRLLILVFLSILIPMVGLSLVLKTEITENILKEKREKLFGLARQLDRYLEGSFDDILRAEGALDASRERKIAVLNKRLRDITDFVASGNEGVGVGYYSRELDAVLTYGPSAELGYTVGQSIFPGHQGYEVMATGRPMVQTGRLVRGDILNCMWPVKRNGKTIGYIWSNETLDHVDGQLAPIIKRVRVINGLIFFLIYASVTLTTQSILEKVTRIKKGIEALFDSPHRRIPPVAGELSIIAETVNELMDKMDSMRNYNKNILEGVLNGVLAVSLDGAVTRANKAFFELFPDFSEASIGRDYRACFDPGIASVIAEGLAADGPRSGIEVSTGNGILDVYTNRMTDEDGAKLGNVFVFRDITLVRRYERELEEKERAAALGGMALGVVHELKNPLTSVKGFAQLLRRPGVSAEKRGRYAELIDTELDRMNRLLNEMLVFGGKSRLELKERDLVPLLRDSVARNDWNQLGAHPAIKLPDEGNFSVRVDEFKAGQVFDNVLKNASEAILAKGRGRIVIMVKDEGESVLVRFVDTGIGIRSEDMDKIGKPLFTTKPNGTGFGLAISRKIMEAHGGTLSVESRLGAYTKVSLGFPKDAESRDTPLAAPEASAP